MAAWVIGSLKVVDGRLDSASTSGLLLTTSTKMGVGYMVRDLSSNRMERSVTLLEPPWHICNETLASSVCRFKKPPCKNKEVLKEAIFLVWNSIKLDITKKLVDSMPRRCAAVIAAHGGQRKYTDLSYLRSICQTL